MLGDTKQASESLLTRKSLALSLAAPRVPPHGTAHRALLAGVDSTTLPWARHHVHTPHNTTGTDESHKIGLHRRLVEFLHRSATTRKKNSGKKHPHLPTDPEMAEHLTRWLGVWCPLSWQNWLRDSGRLRAFIDNLMTCAAPTFALASPDRLTTFQQLTQQCQTLRYGHHPKQIVDLFWPENNGKQARGLVFFVHGGAWGSGSPWLYRLVASPFLNIGMAVAVVGYRTYPCGDVLAQVHDLELASEELAQQYPELCQQPTELGVIVMGHSSGAHIAFLMMAEWTRRRMAQLEKQQHEKKTEVKRTPVLNRGMRLDAFVGISGPYNISHHFDYEASRGLEEISPLKPACGFSRNEFRKHSPALKIVDCMLEWSRECETRALDNIMPRIVLMHGIEDDVVPFTSSAEAASLLRSCGMTKLEEMYLARTHHNECAMQLMIGGQVQDILVDWVQKLPEKRKTDATKTVVMSSRL